MLRFFEYANRVFGYIGKFFQSPLLLILRLFFGISFAFAGWHKLQDISKFSDTLLTMHVPYPETMAWLTAFTELICGLCLAIGFLSRIVSVPLIIVMGFAYALAHTEGFQTIITDPLKVTREAPFNYLLTTLLVFAFGPGLFSLDELFFKREKKFVK